MSARIINFHDVSDKNWFEKTLSIFMNKYNMVDIKAIEDYYYIGKKLKNSCHITIDDGDKTFYWVIYPILKKYNIPATLFVSPKACINKENFWFQEIADFDEDNLKQITAEYLKIKPELLSSYPIKAILKNLKLRTIWDIICKYKKQYNITKVENRNISVEQLLEIDKEGLVTIGAHTLNHPILANEEDEDSQFEIRNSIDELEDILGRDVRYFAYPNGIPKLDFGEREICVLKEKGCRLSFSTELRNISRKDNKYAIPRQAFSYEGDFLIKVKLFLGSFLENIKRIKTLNEKKQRLELKIALNYKE